MFCSAWRLWFYVVSWSIWPNDHHMSTNLDFSMFPSQTELLSTKKRPKIYVTGLKISKNDMIFMTMDVCCWPGCFGPSCLLAPCWSCKPATIWQRTSEGLTGRSGVGKKRTNTPGILVHYILGEETHIHYKKTTSEFNLNHQAIFRCWLFCAKLYEVACLYSHWYEKTPKFSPQSPNTKSFFGA